MKEAEAGGPSLSESSVRTTPPQLTEIVQLFQAPAAPRTQQQSNRTRSDSGIAFPLHRLPIHIVVNGDRYRRWLCHLFGGRNAAVAPVFRAGFARPPLLMNCFCRAPEAMQGDFRQAVKAHRHN